MLKCIIKHSEYRVVGDVVFVMERPIFQEYCKIVKNLDILYILGHNKWKIKLRSMISVVNF